ncbi:hypothetical protein VTH8203_02839 [Vibrio thalassae]|uniref:Uncharacterized protein n=1 Tax=Vibrio thalassae TaxID=1243014 RepID=A0A240EKS2_9VIBR|nr:hypothetical protein [Vibrio thalassae]SNX49196.1 hypothetical protein VTH8203_02839 [Vibrio thalassae]
MKQWIRVLKGALILTLPIHLIACKGSNNDSSSGGQSPYVRLLHPDVAEEKSIVEVTVDTNVDLDKLEWFFSDSDIKIVDGDKLNTRLLTMPSTGIEGDKLTIDVKGYHEDDLIERSSQIVIKPIVEEYKLDGLITDSPIINADITFNIVGSNRKVNAVSDDAGYYQVEIELDDDEPSLVYVEAQGKGQQANAKLVRMIGDFREKQSTNSEGVSSYNVTNLTTAEYTLAKEENSGLPFPSFEHYNEKVKVIDENTLLNLATIVKVVIDGPGYSSQEKKLPDNIENTLDLISVKKARDEFLYNAINTVEFNEAKNKMLSDKRVMSGKLELESGSYVLFPINSSFGMVIDIVGSKANISSVSGFVGSFDFSIESGKLIITPSKDDFINIGFLLDINSGGDEYQEIKYCQRIELEGISSFGGKKLVNFNVECLDESDSELTYSNQYRLYSDKKISYNSTNKELITVRESYKMIMPNGICQANLIDCKEYLELYISNSDKRLTFEGKPLEWDEESKKFSVNDNVHFYFVRFYRDYFDVILESGGIKYPVVGKILEGIKPDSAITISGDYVLSNKEQHNRSEFLTLESDGDGIIWVIDPDSSVSRVEKHILQWVQRNNTIELRVNEIQKIYENELISVNIDECNNENNCELFYQVEWKIVGESNNKIHVIQTSRSVYDLSLQENISEVVLSQLEDSSTIDAVNSFRSWQGPVGQTPWQSLVSAVRDKNTEKIKSILPSLPFIKDIDENYIEQYAAHLTNENVVIQSMDDLQSIVDIVNVKIIQLEALLKIDNAASTKDVQALEIEIFLNVSELRFKVENFEEYLKAIMEFDSIPNIHELQKIIYNVDYKVEAYQSAWDELQSYFYSKDFSNLSYETLLDLNLDGVVDQGEISHSL